MIHHAYSRYQPSDADTIRRTAVAQSSWRAQPWIDCGVDDDLLPRAWIESGRRLPYLRDVIDIACREKSESDIVIFTNADIGVVSSCCAAIVVTLQSADACYAFRRDFKRLDQPPPDATVASGSDYPGSDLKAFRVGWWIRHGSSLPDMILAAEGWDAVFRVLIESTNRNTQVSVPNIIWHERHASRWEQPRHRYTLGMQLHNLRLAWSWLAARGLHPASFGLKRV